MANLIGKRFKVHGVEYAVLEKVDKDGDTWRVGIVGNPLVTQVLRLEVINTLLGQEESEKVTLLDKFNVKSASLRTTPSKITLELTEEEFKFVKTWVEVGMKYDEINNR